MEKPFDDAVAADVRDPSPELARLRREQPIQRIDMSAMPGQVPVLFDPTRSGQ